MAEYRSNLVAKRMPHRGIYSGKPYEVAGRIFLPAGTVLAIGDVLKFVPIGENQRVKEVTTLAVGNIGAAAGSLGFHQILDSAGNPVKVERRGPSKYVPAADTFTSPATNATAFAAAGALAGYKRTQVTGSVAKLAGPVHLSVTITTGATLAADTELFVGAMFDGETSTTEIVDPYINNDYLLDV